MIETRIGLSMKKRDVNLPLSWRGRDRDEVRAAGAIRLAPPPVPMDTRAELRAKTDHEVAEFMARGGKIKRPT